MVRGGFFLFILISILFSVPVQAQLYLVDSIDHFPISGANIYNPKGDLIGFSNKQGLFIVLEGSQVEQHSPLQLTVQHVSYDTKIIKLPSLHVHTTISLNPRSIKLDDVIVSVKAKEVIVLKGYYRSLETFNHQHKYFSDGIIEFYIPLKGGKPGYKLIDYRVFMDSTVVTDYNEKMGPFFQISRVPEINRRKLSDRLMHLVQENDGTNRTHLIKKGDHVGYLTKSSDGNSLQFYMDKVLPDSIIKKKLFRIEAHTLQEVNVENYSSTAVNKITPFNLISIYQNEVGTIKRKSEYGHIPYEGLNEFYVTEHRHISLDEYKSIQKTLIKSIYKTQTKSFYTHQFWEDLDQYHIPPINSGLATQLDQNLKIIK